jgi:hypothetical protein
MRADTCPFRKSFPNARFWDYRLAVERMEEPARFDSVALEFRLDGLAVQSKLILDQYTIHPVDVRSPIGVRRDADARKISQARGVFARDCDLRRDRLVEVLQLRQADRRLEIGHAVIEPDVVMDEAGLFVDAEAEIAL